MKDPTNPDKRVIIPIFKIPFSTGKDGKTEVGKVEVVPVSVFSKALKWIKGLRKGKKCQK